MVFRVLCSETDIQLNLFFTKPKQNYKFVSLNPLFRKNVRILLQKCPGTRFPTFCMSDYSVFWQNIPAMEKREHVKKHPLHILIRHPKIDYENL